MRWEKKKVILRTTINILLDEPLEYKILFWYLEVGEGAITLEECVVFPFSRA